jgi:hypothetical protein
MLERYAHPLAGEYRTVKTIKQLRWSQVRVSAQ